MRLLLLAVASLSCAAQTIPLDWVAAMNRIRADSMRGNVSFLASDLLKGRFTPSPGLDIAAEFIASQFRRAGLEPGGNDGYFHNSKYGVVLPNSRGLSGRLKLDDGTYALDAGNAAAFMNHPVDIFNIPLLHVQSDPNGVEGRAVLVNSRDLAGLMPKIVDAKPALIVVLDPDGQSLQRASRASRPHREGDPPVFPRANWLFIRKDIEGDLANAEISLRADAAEDRPFTLTNVVAILPGSDPVLKDSYVFVTAHYDHIGSLPPGEGDRIYNGANDDASGTVSVLELAASLSRLPQRPRRSLVFMAVAGEERGLLGSRAFLRAPSIPLSQIAADLNLEQLGRTDVDGIAHIAKMTVTGFGFTDMSEVLVQAGKDAGVEFYRHQKFSDPFFQASDNYSFAEKGIPSHTLSNGFMFKDYHGLADHWDKLDYENMEKLLRGVTLAVLRLADSEQAPRWNEFNDKTEKFRGTRPDATIRR